MFAVGEKLRIPFLLFPGLESSSEKGLQLTAPTLTACRAISQTGMCGTGKQKVKESLALYGEAGRSVKEASGQGSESSSLAWAKSEQIMSELPRIEWNPGRQRSLCSEKMGRCQDL